MKDLLDYMPQGDKVFSHLRDLYEKRIQDRIFACMEVPSQTIKRFAEQHRAGYCEYPDPKERIKFWDAYLRECAGIHDDSVPYAPIKEFDQGLYGGLVGGQVQFLCEPELGKISSMVSPVLTDLDDYKKLVFDPSNEWFQHYVTQLKIFTEYAAGKFGISHLILIDGLNFIFELVGATQTYLELIDSPELVWEAIDFAYKLNLKVQRTFFENVPLLNGGTCSDVAQWLPGRIVSESVDPFHMTSIDYFEQWGRAPIEKIFSQFDGGIVHIHGNGRHLLKVVSTIGGLKAIFLGDDKGFPHVFDVLDEIKLQTGNMPLIVRIDFDRFCGALEAHELSGGVLYRVQKVPDVDSANRWMDKVHEYSV